VFRNLHERALVPVADEEISIGAVAVGLDPAKITDKTVCVEILFHEGPIRWRCAGIPTPSNGREEFDGSQRVFNDYEAGLLKMVRTGVTNGVAYATYYEAPVTYDYEVTL
jgi:hypothetical protein